MSTMYEYKHKCAVVRGKEYWAVERSDVADAADAVIAELEAGGTAYDAGYQAAKADMEERVYRAEAALDSFLGLDGGKTVVELRATIERLRQDIGWRDRHIDALEAKLEQRT